MLAISVSMFASCVKPESDGTTMRDITTIELVKDMGLAINLGNTFESGNVSGTSWGSPVVTEPMIAGYAKAGFNTIRVPVAWSVGMQYDYTKTQTENNLANATYTIDETLINNIDEVVGWIIDNGMYVILNIHWDGGWWDGFSANKDIVLQEQCMKKYIAIWTQICERFEKYGDYLMFESLNEELGWGDMWNEWDSSTLDNKPVSFDIGNKINQAFVDTVRASGGKNAERHLLIAGYNTNIEKTCDPLFVMPNDPINRCAVSMHYYAPALFVMVDGESDPGWGGVKGQLSWGSEADYEELNNSMDLAKTTFVDKGIPVIIGEFCMCAKNKEEGSGERWTLAVCEAIYTRDMCPVLWDTPGGYYDRYTFGTTNSVIAEGFKEIVKMDRG